MKKLIGLLALLVFSINLTAQINPIRSLKIGDTLPNVELVTLENVPLLLRDKYKNTPTVIIFYRANWCPFCNSHLADLQTYFRPIMKLGYSLIAISTESVENLKKTQDNNYLRYPLLSDVTMGAINAFGIVNGNVAVPSVFISDANHVLQFVYINNDYKIRLSGEEIYLKAKNLSAK